MFRGFGTFIGTVVGGLLPGLFALMLSLPQDHPASYRFSLWLGALLGVAGLVPLIKISPVRATNTETQQTGEAPFPGMLLMVLVVYVFFSHGAWATCQAFCSAYMDTDLNLSAAAIGLITGVAQFAAVLSPLLNPRLAVRYGNGRTLTALPLGFAVSLIPMVLTPTWFAAAVSRLGNMALGAMWTPSFQVFQMELVSSRWRSLAYGIVSMAMGFAFATASFFGGYIASWWGYNSLFVLGMVFSLVSCTIMFFMLKKPLFSTPVVDPG
jgi:MFS family permease